MEVPLPVDVSLVMDCIVYSLGTVKEENNPIDHCRMHVQSVSHWAPANIGPYSQCVMVSSCTSFYSLYDLYSLVNHTVPTWFICSKLVSK